MSAHFINNVLYYTHRPAIRIKNQAWHESATCLLCSQEILSLLQFKYSLKWKSFCHLGLLYTTERLHATDLWK